MIGAQIGGRVGRQLPPLVYRVVIVAVGVAAIVSLLTTSALRQEGGAQMPTEICDGFLAEGTGPRLS